MIGETQGWKLSSVAEANVNEQENFTEVSADAKSNVGVLSVDGFGGVPVMLAPGATVSTVRPYAVGVPVFPAGSVATTLKVYRPSARPANVTGDVHGEKESAPALIEQANVDPGFDEKANVGLLFRVGSAGEPVSVTLGSTVSTTTDRDAVL